MQGLGRVFRGCQLDGTVVGELGLGDLALDLEQEVVAVLFFDWPEYQEFCRGQLARMTWTPAEARTVAAALEELSTKVPDTTLAQQAWTDMKNPDLKVEEIAGVWASIRRFFSECARRELAVESQFLPVNDGVTLRWATAE